jgi:hypothetical protein
LVTSAHRREPPTLAVALPTSETAPLGSPTSLQGMVAALATAPAVVLDGVAPGAYYVRVRTTDGSGVSPTSNELLVLVP